MKEDTLLIKTVLPEFEQSVQTVVTQKLKESERKMDEKDRELEAVKQKLSEMEKDKEKQLEERNKIIEEKNKELKEKNTALEEQRNSIERKNKTIEEKNELLREKERVLEETEKEVESSKEQQEILRKELQDKSSELQEMMILLEQQKTELREKDKQLEEKERLLRERDTQLMEREKQIEEKDRLLEERNKQLQERTDPDPSAPVRGRNSMERLPPNMSGETPDSAAPLKRRSSMDEPPPTMSGEPCSAVSPASGPAAELRLALLGRTGCGKSAAGNSILGREERSQAGASTVRQQSESRQGEVAGRQVTVVETPDCFCPGLSLEELRQDVELCVRLSAPEPHAFLLVLPVKQSTVEERGMLERMEEMNIKESGDDSQISELLEKIEKMVDGNKEKFYSSEIYLETQSQIRAVEEKIIREKEEKREREEREIREKLERCVQETFKKFTESAANFNAQITQHEERITKLEEMLKEERDEKRKAEMKEELEIERQQRNELQSELVKLKEENENEKKEMEERHRQEMEEIREMYEGEARMEAERNLMKIILPEIQQRYWEIMMKKQKDFDCRMDEKEREIETLRQRLRQEVRELIPAAGDVHQEDTSGLFSRLTQQLFWRSLSDPVINTQSDQ